jgi:hypothetical protein
MLAIPAFMAGRAARCTFAVPAPFYAVRESKVRQEEWLSWIRRLRLLQAGIAGWVSRRHWS